MAKILEYNLTGWVSETTENLDFYKTNTNLTLFNVCTYLQITEL